MGGRGGSSGVSSGGIHGDVTFEQIINASDNMITFNKVVTMTPKGFMPVMGRKSDLGSLVEKHNIKDAVINMYRDRSGANDLKRMQDLGFKVVAQYKGKSTSSSIPPIDYYYMKRG